MENKAITKLAATKGFRVTKMMDGTYRLLKDDQTPNATVQPKTLSGAQIRIIPTKILQGANIKFINKAIPAVEGTSNNECKIEKKQLNPFKYTKTSTPKPIPVPVSYQKTDDQDVINARNEIEVVTIKEDYNIPTANEEKSEIKPEFIFNPMISATPQPTFKPILWDTYKDLEIPPKNASIPQMLQTILNNQIISDMKQNEIQKEFKKLRHEIYLELFEMADSVPVEPKRKGFKEIKIDSNLKFEALDNKLKIEAEQERFERLLHKLKKSASIGTFINIVTRYLFDPDWQKGLGWAHNGHHGVKMKGTNIMRSIINVCVQKFPEVCDRMVEAKFSQHFRSFNYHNSQKLKKRAQLAEMPDSFDEDKYAANLLMDVETAYDEF